jgi:hypothetical protein
MLDDLRKPFFILALVLIGAAVLLETGSTWMIQVTGSLGSTTADKPAAGFGVPSIALLDALLILTVALMALSLLLPERVQGRLQGLVTLCVSIVVLLAAVVLLFAAITAVTLMLGLLLAPIFGTIAYFALFASFDRASAAAILSLVMLLKLGFAVCLVLAQQRFLENKGLVLLIATSLLAVLLVSFLHSLVPGFLVSITDLVGAIIVTILTLIWAVVFLFGAVISVVKAVT